MRSTTAFRGWLLTALATVAAALPLASLAQTPTTNPDALALLRRATDYLAGTKQFSLVADTTIEFVDDTGQKLQLAHRVSIDVQRPDKMRIARVGDLVDQTFYYNGKSLAVDLPEDNYHATAAVPATIDAMLDFARDMLDVIAPGSDLIYEDAYARLTTGLTSAFIVGKSEVGGVQCDHVAFRNNVVDWQIWIQEGDTPIPRKMVVNSKRLAQSPEFAITLSSWNPAPRLSMATFEFVPSAASKKIEFRPPAHSGDAKQ